MKNELDFRISCGLDSSIFSARKTPKLANFTLGGVTMENLASETLAGGLIIF
jgi:hypothetical protein